MLSYNFKKSQGGSLTLLKTTTPTKHSPHRPLVPVNKTYQVIA